MSSTPTAPVLGPCTAWIDGEYAAGCCSGATAGQLETVAIEASMLLYEISGRRFPGVCSRVVRPCAQPCSCWGSSLSSGYAWYWGNNSFGSWGWWRYEGGDRLGCAPMSRVKLAGYPVRDIVEVRIGGEIVDPATYRLDEYRYLTRLDDPGPPVTKRFWPACQNLSLDAGEPGTFTIEYEWGTDPPELGRQAAAELACQLFKACPGNGGPDCDLPTGATRVVRQGIEVDRGLLVNFLDPSKPTGLVAVDMFLAGYGLTGRAHRKSAIYSPDVQQYARRLGPA